MKITVFAALLLTMLASVGSCQNLVTNPGFEATPIPGLDQAPAGWVLVDEGWANMRDYHWLVQSDVKYSGDHALKMYLGPTAWGAGWGIYQTVNVNFGRVYEARAKWRVDGANPSGENYLGFFVYPTSWIGYTDARADLFAAHATRTAWGHPALPSMPFDWESTRDAPYTAYPPSVAGTAHYRSRIKAGFTGRITLFFRLTALGGSLGTILYLDDVELFEVNAAYSVQGTVTDATSGLPVEGATVSVSTGGVATTDANGYYKIYYPDAGACNITAAAPRYYDSTVSANLAVRTDVTGVNLTVTRKPTGTLQGTVTDGTSPIPNATVSISPGDYVAQTNDLGFYSLLVEEGTHTANASAPGYLPASSQVTISDGQTTTKDFALTLRYVNPANALANGDFENGMTGWTEWSATHFTDHSKYVSDCPGYKDQWVVGGSATRVFPSAEAGEGVGGSAGLKMGMLGGQWAAVGGVRQQCYVVPGRYYRARAMFRGAIDGTVNDYEAAIGLVQGRFDPGIYSQINNPPPFADDVFKMECGHESATLMDLVMPEQDKWWHNILATRRKSYNGMSPWGWESTMDYIAPRNLFASAVRQATGETMTVVLKVMMWGSATPAKYVVFDNVVLEEVSPPSVSMSIADLARIDTSLPYSAYADVRPDIEVDFSSPANAKLVTAAFTSGPEPYYYLGDADRTAGIRLDIPDWSSYSIQQGDTISFKGKLDQVMEPMMGMPTGERNIVADVGSVQIVGSGTPPGPLGISAGSLSSKFPYFNPLAQSIAPANTGLLVRVSGRVVEYMFDFYSRTLLRIDDGSGAEVWVRGHPADPPENSVIAATGILGLDMSPMTYSPVFVVQVRENSAADDFQVVYSP